MECNKVSLYKCLYGMELFKKQFSSEKALTSCMKNILSFYRQRHAKGETAGIMDFNGISLDIDSGNIADMVTVPFEKAIGNIDIIKFLPPEVINGDMTFDELQDRYCLAVLLFSVRYFSNPFDGASTYAFPTVTAEAAKKIYGAPIFVFGMQNKGNFVTSCTASSVIRKWENEKNTKLKELFTACFTDGIKNHDMRPDVNGWLTALGTETDINAEKIFLDTDGKKIQLIEGMEIFECDLYDGGSSEKKIAVVLKSKKNDDILALGNVSDDTWSVYMADSREIMITPKNVAPLVNGATIGVGNILVNVISEKR